MRRTTRSARCHGIQHCVGAALARLETHIALRAFLDTFARYTIDHDTITWKQSLAFRSPTHLPVLRDGDNHSTVRPGS